MSGHSNTPARWQFWIDRGGTFTDVIGRAPDGRLHTLKLLSEHPEQYADAAVEGIRRLLGLAVGEAVTARQVECVKMGTTVATNALLERRGEPLLLVTTRGLGDQLRIAYQHRPKLFARHIELPPPLYARVLEADERIGADGAVIRPLDEAALATGLREAHAAGLRACAICFMHGWRHTQHEARAAALAREAGFTQISVSHALSPLMKFVARGDTTVADAYLGPVLRRYVDRLAQALPGVRIEFMQSSGGLVEAARFQGKDAVLSGPAGGINGMVRTGLAAGHRRLIGFDMGGTSTDVSHFAGDGILDAERDFDTTVAGVRLRVPMLAIHTVAAGGGSIIRFDGARLRVGPESAGADPGPACYRRGGPLTVTDANLLLGRIRAEEFPALFGPRGDQPLDRELVVRRFEALAREMGAASAESVAEGAIAIAVASMAQAIKKISIARGHDLVGYTLHCFGGAGGQHACAVADQLGIERIYLHPLASLLSAYGMGLAEPTAMREASLELALDAAGLQVAAGRLDALAEAACEELRAQGVAADRIELRRRLHLRYAGTDTALVVDAANAEGARAAFEAAYRRRYAFLMPGRALLIEAVAAQAIGSGGASAAPAPEAVSPMTPVDGPARIAEPNTTVCVDAGWRATRAAGGALELQRVVPIEGRSGAGTALDPVRLELFNHLFMALAEQMGLVLQNTAHSVNIKERLDFSCALFDAEGALIANAPHMPVHLGSMGESILHVIRTAGPSMREGDVYLLNDPYHGGTHLPDITVVTPVWLHDERPAFYVASRGHHADVGGLTPGSMPPFSTTIDEEGVRFDCFLLVRDGALREVELMAALGAGRYPARNPAQTLADLRAQIAANEKGRSELLALVERHGAATVRAYMGHVQNNAEASVRRAIGALRDGSFAMKLDNGARIEVAIRVDGAARGATIDFSGTSEQLASNFNAPKAVTMAAVLYVFRCLVDDDIPLNAGCLRPLTVVVPAGSMLNPRPPAAVVAGNVETSQCVTNALFGALGLMASGQPTMNNFSFGNARHQYYETIAGGSGAGVWTDDGGAVVGGFDGTAVVQTHMTNSRLTDPEVLEHRFPVRLERFAIRPGSGGAGRWRGGDGALRAIRFLESMSASILANGRREPAFGLAGGAPGEVGANRVERVDGSVEALDHIGSVEMAVGDLFVIETPGGGGYGSAG
ncbi:hydantoinase B/oxoprolinase family protein [Rivibacter subsaxonicus]|uniref:5-oxoprolinase (ATP-hydrolysing) n=1 Tax=Rivibacter subsaxonicus TaxID=457575 RepID=A0A4Q7VP80_9BURK|nr:hydantoinase B/oxoprolinase family protein [Rivibacter subsaxonicus]RZT97928.1 5-oxoprolinase (ATP-hydrolysing) [Rivibacter subsaxonicus]